MIKYCTCYHEAQNKFYGNGQRVHNYALKGNQGRPGWRCTVCSNVKSAGKNDLEDLNLKEMK